MAGGAHHLPAPSRTAEAAYPPPFTLADDAPFDDDSESEDDGPDGTGRAPAHAALLALGPLRGVPAALRDAEASPSGGEPRLGADYAYAAERAAHGHAQRAAQCNGALRGHRA